MSISGAAILVTSAGQGIGRAETSLGGFDVMVNNAGIAQVQPIADVTPDEVDKMLKVNVQGGRPASRCPKRRGS